jgi:acetyltransferase-like isoleucine patch superfamily enzyme
VKDVPPGATVVSAPARVLLKEEAAAGADEFDPPA